MRWYKDEPEEGDFVVITVTDVDKNSAYAELEEYGGRTGLIHISEVSRSWVQDVSKELKEGEKDVAQVIDTGDPVSLSLKRVNDNQKKEIMGRWNKEKKAEEFLENLAEELGKDKEELYEEVAFPMQQEFGSSFKAFEVAIGEEERLLELFDERTVKAIQEVSKDNIDLKKEKLEGEIELRFDQGDGIEHVREVLSEPGEGVNIGYISAPVYSITAWGRNSQLAKKRMDETVDKLREKAESLDGAFEFSRA